MLTHLLVKEIKSFQIQSQPQRQSHKLIWAALIVSDTFDFNSPDVGWRACAWIAESTRSAVCFGALHVKIPARYISPEIIWEACCVCRVCGKGSAWSVLSGRDTWFSLCVCTSEIMNETIHSRPFFLFFSERITRMRENILIDTKNPNLLNSISMSVLKDITRNKMSKNDPGT